MIEILVHTTLDEEIFHIPKAQTESIIEPGTDEPSGPAISVLVNWFEELKERVPVPQTTVKTILKS